MYDALGGLQQGFPPVLSSLEAVCRYQALT
jgi:hypothetical protein